MIIYDWQFCCVIVIEPLGSLGLQQEVFVIKGFHNIGGFTSQIVIWQYPSPILAVRPDLADDLCNYIRDCFACSDRQSFDDRGRDASGLRFGAPAATPAEPSSHHTYLHRPRGDLPRGSCPRHRARCCVDGQNLCAPRIDASSLRSRWHCSPRASRYTDTIHCSDWAQPLSTDRNPRHNSLCAATRGLTSEGRRGG